MGFAEEIYIGLRRRFRDLFLNFLNLRLQKSYFPLQKLKAAVIKLSSNPAVIKPLFIDQERVGASP